MKVVYTSDLHIDVSDGNRRTVAAVSRLVREARPDVVVVAGDAGNTIETLEETLSYFDGVDARKFFVPGNHDVWIESANGALVDSRSKYARLIPDACRRRGFHDLGQEPVVIGEVGFVGSLGWYDYSFADPRLGLGEDDYWKGRYGDEIWWDKKMTYWVAPPDSGPVRRSGGEEARERMRDIDVCREMTARLDADLRSIEGSVTKIISIIHTLPFFVGIPRSDPPYYLDAYTGSARLGEVLQGHKKVEHCIHGHKHTSGEWTVGGVRVYRRTLGRIGEGDHVDSCATRAVGSIVL